MIGKRSIFTTILVNNIKQPAAPFEVTIQANKNGGICDVIIPKNQLELVKPSGSPNGDSIQAYNDIGYVEKSATLRSEILNRYQGRQISGAYVEETIKDFLSNLLNK